MPSRIARHWSGPPPHGPASGNRPPPLVLRPRRYSSHRRQATPGGEPHLIVRSRTRPSETNEQR
ncbi:hypothetical protein [Ornithinimicrobium kibberense]|uniref:hypothetical protein n=1 Tax=Ornithinimicrobium kibberense TaxID=282060 RepID=UPI0036163332